MTSGTETVLETYGLALGNFNRIGSAYRRSEWSHGEKKVSSCERTGEDE